MKKQSDNKSLSDWQILNYYGTELDNNQETDGIEEEEEYKFFSLLRESHDNPRKHKIKTKNS